MKLVLSVIFLFTMSETAWAVDLPKFDVRLHCASAGDASACERSEESARAVATAKWASYPEQRKHFCVQAETFLAKVRRSYTNLTTCLGEPQTTS
jgi:hypothetical protein